MSLAEIVLAALVVVVVLSCVTTVNVGLLALALAWLIGALVAPMFGATIGASGVVAGFPIELFLTLSGVTMFFTIAEQNGTLRRLADWGLSLCHGRPALVPAMFFGLALILSATGAGNVPTVALLAPTALGVAQRLGISPLVMTLMIGHGSIAGTLSPLSPMAATAHEQLTDMALGQQQL